MMRFARSPLSVWCISPTGLSKEELSKQAILARFPALYKRDLELFSRSTSEILLRRASFFLKLEHIRVLVSEKEVMVFDDNPIAAEFATRLRFDAFGGAQPIEEAVLEAALIFSHTNFQNRLALLDPLARRLLRELVSSANEDSSLRLIPVKTAISRFHTALVAYKRALERDDLVLGMHVTSKPLPDLPHALSVLLADYRTRAEEVLGALEDLREEVESVESTITQVLSASRNDLMRLNLRISMVALACGVSSMGFSALGMNLVNGWETSPYAFPFAVTAIAAGGLGAYGIASMHYRRGTSQYRQVIEDESFFASLGSPQFVHSIFAKDLLEESNVRLLLRSALGRDLTPQELEEVKSSADADGDLQVTLPELLQYVSLKERD
jgi:hypothetical protein